jgi:hypothetical protein
MPLAITTIGLSSGFVFLYQSKVSEIIFSHAFRSCTDSSCNQNDAIYGPLTPLVTENGSPDCMDVDHDLLPSVNSTHRSFATTK